MNNNALLNYKDPVIIGLGASGLSVARYFSRCGQSFTVVDAKPSVDKLDQLQQFAVDTPCILGELPAGRLLEADLLVVSPGVDLQSPEIAAAIAAGVEVIGDIGLFLQQVSAPIIAVTGTNGKSTVCAALGHVLSSLDLNVCVAGNIGMPVLDTLTQAQPDYYILELSSFQLELIDNLNAEVALCLNITPDHLDRHHTMQQYLFCKQKIYNGCTHAVVNIDCPQIWQDLSFPGFENNSSANFKNNSVIGFSIESEKYNFKNINKVCSLGGLHADEKNKEIFMEVDSTPYISLNDLSPALSSLPQNALAVLSVLVALDMDLSKAKPAFASFNALKHRCQLVEIDGYNDLDLCFYNDSKATNIGAAQSSLRAIYNRNKQKIIWIAGGQSKGVDVKALQPFINKYVAAMVVIGEDADIFARLAGSNVECVKAGDMSQVVAQAASLAEKYAVNNILLAPACASFDEYANFQDRGDKFVAAVKKWVSESG